MGYFLWRLKSIVWKLIKMSQVFLMKIILRVKLYFRNRIRPWWRMMLWEKTGREVALGEPSYCQNYGDNVMTTFDHFLQINVIISYMSLFLIKTLFCMTP